MSDSNNKKRTMILQTVLVMNIFSSLMLRPRMLTNSLYLVMEVSDSNDLKRTMVLQVILIVNMFASLVPRTRLITYSHLECP